MPHFAAFNLGLCCLPKYLFSRISKDNPTVFKDLKFMKNPDLSIEILLQKSLTEIMEKLVLDN